MNQNQDPNQRGNLPPHLRFSTQEEIASPDQPLSTPEPSSKDDDEPQFISLAEAQRLFQPVFMDKPFVSVIVPVRNEEGYIGRCLQALGAQTYPRHRYEVIVIDGESTDQTERETRETSFAYGVPDYYKSNSKHTTASGLNLGLEVCAGDVIIRVDGHTRVDPSFIEKAVEALEETGADAVGGPIRTRGTGALGRAIALAMSSPFGVGDAAFRHSDKQQWTDSVPFAAYRASVFGRIGLFDETIDHGEDDEFNYRLRESGGRILLTPAIKSVYYSRGTLKELQKQYWGYGLAKAQVVMKHPRRLRWRHLIPSAFVLTISIGSFLSLFKRRVAWIPALAATSYAVVNAIASLRIARDDNWKEAQHLPAAFASMHISAGAGMIAGLAKALLNRRRRNDAA